MHTRWHITFGTYATRLHGCEKPTVDRRHNKLGEPQIFDVPAREYDERQSLRDRPIFLTHEQQRFVETVIPVICDRGGWTFIECSAASNHIHVVLEADSVIHGKRIRPLLKRWLTQAMNERWTGATKRPDGMTWWAEGGSTRAVHGQGYRQAVEGYVAKQRATPY